MCENTWELFLSGFVYWDKIKTTLIGNIRQTGKVKNCYETSSSKINQRIHLINCEFLLVLYVHRSKPCSSDFYTNTSTRRVWSTTDSYSLSHRRLPLYSTADWSETTTITLIRMVCHSNLMVVNKILKFYRIHL